VNAASDRPDPKVLPGNTGVLSTLTKRGHRFGPPVLPWRTTVFVDGLNFHFGVAKRFGRRWIDLPALCRRVLSPRWHAVTEVRLYTAPFVEGRQDGNTPENQNAYLHALQLRGGVAVQWGRFSLRPEFAPLASDPTKVVRVLLAREKGSDVNMAADLVHLGCADGYEAAVLVSNDSDFAGAIRIVRDQLNKPVGIVNPRSGQASRELVAVSSFARVIRRGDVEASLLPDVVRVGHESVSRPSDW
jgi:uncharacterized LabA/DUF88 family protein